MASLKFLIMIVLLVAPALAIAHSGPALDSHGCHYDRVRGNYHCHTGQLNGLVFKSKGEMLKAVASGDLPEAEQKKGFISRVLSGDDADSNQSPSNNEQQEHENGDSDGFFSRMSDKVAGVFGKKKNPEPSPAGPDADSVASPEGTSVEQPQGLMPEKRTIEDRLKILKGLSEMGLITQQEYDKRRAEILQEL